MQGFIYKYSVIVKNFTLSPDNLELESNQNTSSPSNETNE